MWVATCTAPPPLFENTYQPLFVERVGAGTPGSCAGSGVSARPTGAPGGDAVGLFLGSGVRNERAMGHKRRSKGVKTQAGFLARASPTLPV